MKALGTADSIESRRTNRAHRRIGALLRAGPIEWPRCDGKHNLKGLARAIEAADRMTELGCRKQNERTDQQPALAIGPRPESLELPQHERRRSYIALPAGTAPASANTAEAPAPTSDATLPSSSTMRADGVPQAPKI